MENVALRREALGLNADRAFVRALLLDPQHLALNREFGVPATEAEVPRLRRAQQLEASISAVLSKLGPDAGLVGSEHFDPLDPILTVYVYVYVYVYQPLAERYAAQAQLEAKKNTSGLAVSVVPVARSYSELQSLSLDWSCAQLMEVLPVG